MTFCVPLNSLYMANVIDVTEPTAIVTYKTVTA